MVATYRALASVVMLAGFYLVALAQLAAVGALVVWLGVESHSVVAVKLAIPLFAALGAVAVALWRAIRAKSEPEPGLILGPDQAPRLWGAVRELATAVGTRMPDEIRVVPEVNAAVSEDTKLLGLVAGRRILYVGLPLLQAMSVDQLRAVLAHELGHYSGRHTRFGAVAYRGRLAIGGTLARIGPYNPIGWVFKGYARLYLLVDNAASRSQELEADRAAVRLAGRAAAASALRELPVLDAAWGFYFRRYVEPGWDAGYAPDDFFGGFGDLVAARKQELDDIRAQEPDKTPSRWDTHPPIGERIAVISAAPEATAFVPDDRPAAVLVGDVVGVGRRLQASAITLGQRTVLPWPQFTSAAVAVGVQREADVIYRAVGRFTRSADVGLPAVLELVRAGRLGEFAEQFFAGATRREAAQRFAEPMALLLRNAAVSSGAAIWRHSWSGPAELIDTAGEPLDLDGIAALAVSPQTLDEALTRLAGLGIRVERATIVARQVTPDGADLVGALANVKVNGGDHDLLVLDRGLVFVGNPGKSDQGRQRLRALVGSAPVAMLAKTNHFLPYEEIASVVVRKRVPTRADLTLHDGTTVTLHEAWSSEELEKNSRDTLLQVLDRIGAIG
ncbi:M48 family metalloprotease [Micromonospora zhanjiangensis]|uniref:M48 family metalloprotease n=1 Tax=Micromonospora zhanjiangensis TaxID=1522057 RepID=A0ABV8KW54_9ACTN